MIIPSRMPSASRCKIRSVSVAPAAEPSPVKKVTRFVFVVNRSFEIVTDAFSASIKTKPSGSVD